MCVAKVMWILYRDVSSIDGVRSFSLGVTSEHPSRLLGLLTTQSHWSDCMKVLSILAQEHGKLNQPAVIGGIILGLGSL